MSSISSDGAAVGEGTTVTLHFTLTLEDGTQVDTTRDKKPATFDFGDGNLPPGFEQPLKGMHAGERDSFTISPEHAFGQYNEQNVQLLTRDAFSDDIELEVGTVVSFTDPAGGELPGVIKTVEGEQVDVDFNHPLAGKVLVFDAEIISVKPTTTH